MRKEGPILFSTPMVQAILEGRKTVTRRVVKPQPDDDGLWNHTQHKMALDSILEGWHGTIEANGESKEFKCPYGHPGDRLWVRETFAVHEIEGNKCYYYKADIPNKTWDGDWKPSIFMPRSACRILLETTEVRVERLQDISEEGAVAEGIRRIWDDGRPLTKNLNNYTIDYSIGSYSAVTAKEVFEFLWKEINGEKSWEVNPWVWVIKFKRIEAK